MAVVGGVATHPLASLAPASPSPAAARLRTAWIASRHYIVGLIVAVLAGAVLATTAISVIATPMRVAVPAVTSSSGPAYNYDYRPDFARPPPPEAYVYAYDSSTNSLDLAGEASGVRSVSSGSEVEPSAPRTLVGAGDDIVGSGHATLRPTQDWISRSAVDDYAARLRAGERLQPIEVQRLRDGREFILDGHHRYVASQQTGIPVEINYVDGVGPVGLPDWLKVTYEP